MCQVNYRHKLASGSIPASPEPEQARQPTVMNCMDCAFRGVLPDPDPDDWFCDDDEKVICMKSAGRAITIACRPHHKRDECSTPSWCPLGLGSAVEPSTSVSTEAQPEANK